MLTPQMIKTMMIRERLLNEGQQVHEEDDLVRNGMIDSIGIIKLVLAVEQAYGLKVEVEDILKDDFRTVGAIVDYFNRFVK
ncbi:acyl carrier protein [Paenibacillus sp. SYP-B4298]|uniref:acyl carrier protein n=1 Tax=Paenibacillus sp. SYP-B4298 TaxID=2996034 RepID=UPI0022DE0B96|nr:acyl carrier protein [Paenibacillus sp. SYP-B4298]